ncbi:zf-CCHC domain-containing protein [Tanacetum coccineum]
MLRACSAASNISSRGLDIDLILCLVCSEHVESISHAFFSCSAASNIWRLVRGWCDLKIPTLSFCDEWDICLNRSMDSDKYLEGQSMQRPPLFESDHFIYWKNRFETYVKAKDLDLWHIILNGDFPPLAKNEVTQILEVVPFEEQSDDLKKKLAKNNEAKMVLYNALPKKEYERIFMCKTAKDIWQSLLITHQGHEVVMEKDSEIYKGKKERLSPIPLKAKNESKVIRKGKFVRQPREENKSFRQRDEKKGKSDRKCFRCGDPNNLIRDCPKPSRNKDQKAFIGGSWSDSENDAEDKTNDETCLMAQSSNEVTLNSSHYSDDASSLDNDSMQIEFDSLCEIS